MYPRNVLLAKAGTMFSRGVLYVPACVFVWTCVFGAIVGAWLVRLLARQLSSLSCSLNVGLQKPDKFGMAYGCLSEVSELMRIYNESHDRSHARSRVRSRNRSRSRSRTRNHIRIHTRNLMDLS